MDGIACVLATLISWWSLGQCAALHVALHLYLASKQHTDAGL